MIGFEIQLDEDDLKVLQAARKAYAEDEAQEPDGQANPDDLGRRRAMALTDMWLVYDFQKLVNAGLLKRDADEPDRDIFTITLQGLKTLEALDNDDTAPKEGSIQIVAAERPGAEDQLDQVLSALRRIDEQIPAEAKLPGSPNLTDQMAHLLKQYTDSQADLDMANGALDEYRELFGDLATATTIRADRKRLLKEQVELKQQAEAANQRATKAESALDDLQHDIGVWTDAGVFFDKDDLESMRSDLGEELYELMDSVRDMAWDCNFEAFVAWEGAKAWKQAAKLHKHNEHCWYDWWSFTAKLYTDEHKRAGKLREAIAPFAKLSQRYKEFVVERPSVMFKDYFHYNEEYTDLLNQCIDAHEALDESSS